MERWTTTLLNAAVTAAVLAAAGPCLAQADASADMMMAPPARPAPPAEGLAGLGPLEPEVALGHAGAWTARAAGGRLVLSNPGDAGAVRFYGTPWRGDLAAGRSLGARVGATGGGALSAAGLVFRILDGDPRWMAWVVTSDGKAALYWRKPDELKLVQAVPIPGGHRPEGDLLQVDQHGDAATLLVNGRVVTDVPRGADGRAATVPAPAGVIALGTGEFTFGDVAFGPSAIPAPGGAAGTEPVAKPVPKPVPTPQAGGDAVVPHPPQPAATGPVRQVEVPGLGPLGHAVEIGPDGVWSRTVEGGRLVFADASDGDGIYTRTMDWPGSPAQGRSVTLRVGATGASDPMRGGGLVFGYGDGGARYLALVVTPQRKGGLFQVRGGDLNSLALVDLPADHVGDDLVQVSQSGDTTTLLVDGRKVAVLKPDDGLGLDVSGGVGLIALGVGRYAFGDFSFGSALAGTATGGQ